MDVEHAPLDTRRNTLRAREVLLQGLILLALLVAVFPGVFFRGECVIPGDILLQSPPWDSYAPPGFERPNNRLMVDIVTAFMAYYSIAKEAFQAGEWPLWNPREYLGMPLMANMQSAICYPPRLLHGLFDIHLAQNLYVLLKLWLCGMTAFLCGRLLKLTLGTSCFLSVAWMLASYNLIWAEWSLTDVAAWLPVTYLGIEFTLSRQYQRGLFATALGGTLLLLAGHPETAFAMGLCLGFYFFLRLLVERRRGSALWAPLAVQAAAWTLILMTCAMTVVPFLEYLRNSYTYFSRGEGEPRQILPFGALISAWVPRFFGTMGERNYLGCDDSNSNIYSMVYPGIAVWLGIALLLVKGETRLLHKARIVCLAAAGLLSLLIAFNFYALAWVNRMPMFSSMFIYYHTAGVAFIVPLLAAFGIENWFSRPRKLREAAWTLVILVPGILLVSCGYAFQHDLIQMKGMLPYCHKQLALFAVFAVASLCPLVAYAIWGRSSVFRALLTVALAADLLVLNHGMNPTLNRALVYPPTKLTEFLKGLPQPARVGTGEGNVASGLMPIYGIDELLGYDGLYPARVMRLVEEVTSTQWKAIVPALSVEYYLHDSRFEPSFPLRENPERFRLLGEFDGLQVYQDTAAMPRAYLLEEARTYDGFEDFLTKAGEPGFNPTRVAYLESPLPEGLGNIQGDGTRGTATVVRRSTTRVSVDVDAPRRSIVVLAEAYYPGWAAYVDGTPESIFPVDYVLRGVVVEPGQHRVEFEYNPPSFRAGLATSTLACAGSIVWITLAAIMSRKRQKRKHE